MIIKSLEEMEQIVKKNSSLVWDGWTVVERQQAKNAAVAKNGKRINNRWYIESRFELDSDGWNIPDKLVNKNGQA